MFKFSTKRLARAGIIAALYAAVTYLLAPYAYGPFQIRPAEALTVLPLFFPEAIPGLFVGCALANLMSGYGIYDIVFGSLITLIAAATTFYIGKALKRNFLSVILGGLPPILLNAVGIPVIIILVSADSWAAYITYFLQMLLTQSVWIYALGIPLFFAMKRLTAKLRFFKNDEEEEKEETTETKESAE